MIFKRKIYDEMLRWKSEEQGRSALLIKGARRVGKSTVVEEFAKHEYRSYVLIDFANTTRTMHSLFEDLSDLDFFFMRLETESHVKLHRRESVIIFDEVQRQPLARQAIKYLVKDGRYDYIETGSLLTLKKNVQNIVIPSEEYRLTLRPLDFEEFLWAVGLETHVELLHKLVPMQRPLEQTHRTIMRDLRLYMLIGGMPQAINTYIETNNLQAVDNTKRKILDLYEDDFRKIDGTGNASRLLRAIPSQVSSNASRYMVSSATENRNTPYIETVIADMEDSMVISLAYHANDPNVGFGLSRSINRFKLYLVDTGLFITLAFRDKKFTDNIIYNKLLSDKLEANLGYVYENLVAQMLSAAGHQLYYYTFPTESGKHNYEIDFLLNKGNKIVPIEVKSSGYRSHKSLDSFYDKFSSRIDEKILLYTKDYHKDGTTKCLPIYFIPFM